MKLMIAVVCLALVSLAAIADEVPPKKAIRREIRSLNASEIQELRSVQEKCVNDPSIDGWNSTAAIHGRPLQCPTWKTPDRMCCPHGTIFFLPWHRCFGLVFELVKRKHAKNLASVYYDWTCPGTELPKAIAEKTYNDTTTNKTRINPLESAFIPYLNKRTTRNVNSRLFKVNEQGRNELCEMFLNACAEEDFCEFSKAIEQAHNNYHSWCGGSFNSLENSAWDPMFELHHANVERAFVLWQDIMESKNLSSSNTSCAGNFGNQPLEPFNSTAYVSSSFIRERCNASTIFDLSKLTYEYDNLGFCCLTYEETKRAIAERKNVSDRVVAVLNATKLDFPAVVDVDGCCDLSNCSRLGSFYFLFSKFANDMPPFLTYSRDITNQLRKICDPSKINETGLITKITAKDADGNSLILGSFVESLQIQIIQQLDGITKLVLQALCKLLTGVFFICKNFVPDVVGGILPGKKTGD